jgi:hypothetical protein
MNLSSLTQMLGTWVPIPFKTWMSACVYSMFVLFCVSVAALQRADPLYKESYQLCIGLRNWKSGQGPTKDCEAISGVLIWVYLLQSEPSSPDPFSANVHIFGLCFISCTVTSVLPDPGVRITILLAIMFQRKCKLVIPITQSLKMLEDKYFCII